MAELIKNNDMAQMVGMTPPAFAKGVASGRFTISGHDKNGHNLFDPDVVIPQYQATAKIAEIQNRARYMPEGMRGGRPKKTDNQQVELFDEKEYKIQNNNNKTDDYLRIKLLKETAQAQLLSMKLQVEKGMLIHKTEVKKQGIQLGEIMVGTITSWPPRLAQEFEAMGKRGCDSHDFQLRLIEECNNLIIEIRKRCEYGEVSDE